MKKIFTLLIAFVLTFSLVACGRTITDEPKPETPTKSATSESTTPKPEPASKNESTPIPKPAAEKSKNFGSLEEISDLVDEAVELLDDATYDVDDFSLMVHLMPASFVNSTIVMGTLLDYAFSGTQDTYTNERTEMPSGNGEYESSLKKNGSVYTWLYNSYLNEGYETYLKLTYDTDSDFVEVFRDGNEKEINKSHVQIKRLGDNAFCATSCELKVDTSKATQLILMGKDNEVYYGYRIIDTTSLLLPVDLKVSNVTDWDSLSNDEEYDFSLTYDGTNLDYTGK